MPIGKELGSVGKLYLEAIRDSANPTKQLELVEKRATWVFVAVGTVGTALSGFTLLAGSQSLIHDLPWLGVSVIVLTLVALGLAASALTISAGTINPNDVDEVETYFRVRVPRRAARAKWAVIALIGAVVIAGVGGLLTLVRRDSSQVALEWQYGADEGTMSLAVGIEDLVSGQTVSTRLIVESDDGATRQLYRSSARADDLGVVAIEADVSVPDGHSQATLTVTKVDGEQETHIDRVSIPIPDIPAVISKGRPLDTLVAATVTSLSDFWASELSDVAPSGKDGLAPPKVTSFDSRLEHFPPLCGGSIAIDEAANNAFFCPSKNFIAWDRALLTQLYPDFGEYAVAAVVAHEWGHWIQQRVKRPPRQHLIEHQADCLAGAWARHEESDRSNDLDLQESSRADALIALVWYAGLTEESGDENQPNPRFTAFLEGVSNGASACRSYSEP